MRRFDHIEDSAFIFGALIMVANKMDTQLNRVLSRHRITAKQWFMLLIIFNLFDIPPTIKDVAREMCLSHQTVKQVALKLESKGFLRLEKDRQDLRITRLHATSKSQAFWQEADADGQAFMQIFYKGIDQGQIHVARNLLAKIMENLDQMEKPALKEEQQR